MDICVRNAEGLFANLVPTHLVRKHQLDALDRLLPQWEIEDPQWAKRARAVREALAPFEPLGLIWMRPNAWSSTRPKQSADEEPFLRDLEKAWALLPALEAVREDFTKLRGRLPGVSSFYDPLSGAARVIRERQNWRVEHLAPVQRLFQSRSIAVLIHEGDEYLADRGRTPDLSKARLFESEAAVERTLRSMQIHSDTVSLLEVEAKVSKIVRLGSEPANQGPSPTRQELHALIEAEAIWQSMKNMPVEALKYRLARLEQEQAGGRPVSAHEDEEGNVPTPSSAASLPSVGGRKRRL